MTLRSPHARITSTAVDFARRYADEVLVLQSEETIAEYNRRIAKQRVVALVHSTC